MTSDPYNEMTHQDHDDLCEWLDEQDLETQRLLNQVCEGVEVPKEDLEGERVCALI